MKPRCETSLMLRDELKRRGYHSELCEAISFELNTEYTAGRMLGYLSKFRNLPQEEVVDEMLAILSDREMFIKKKQSEEAQAHINEFIRSGFE